MQCHSMDEWYPPEKKESPSAPRFVRIWEHEKTVNDLKSTTAQLITWMIEAQRKGNNDTYNKCREKLSEILGVRL